MITAALVTIITVVILTYCLRNAYKKPPNFPPGPPSLPVYGGYWIVLAMDWNSLASAFIKLGRFYKTKIVGVYLGPVTGVIVNDYHLVREMLFNEDFDGRMDIMLARLRAYFKKLGIFFTDGLYWHVQRRFSLRYMRDFGFGRRSNTVESVIEDGTRDIIDMRINGPKYPVENNYVKGELVHLPHYLAPPFQNGLISIVTQTTFDRKDFDVLYKLAEGGLLFQRSSDDIGRALSLTPWLKDVAPGLSGYNALRKGNQVFLDFWTNIIHEAMKTHDEGHDRHYIDMYIRKMKKEIRENGSSSFSVEQLVLMCTDYMFPTSTATTMLITFIIEQMLLQPEIQDKVHEEIDRVVGKDRMPTIDDRQNMPYTEAVIREMMRYETVVPLGIPHRAMKDAKLGGYDIPEGSMVSANYVPMHTSKELWGDPENFRPERFIENGKLCLSKDKSLPFGAGKRLCAGETYARQSMFQVFAGIMQKFSVSTANGKPLTKPSRRIPGIITTIPEFWVKFTVRS